MMNTSYVPRKQFTKFKHLNRILQFKRNLVKYVQINFIFIQHNNQLNQTHTGRQAGRTSSIVNAMHSHLYSDYTEKWANIIKINPNTLIFWMSPIHFPLSHTHRFTHSLAWFISVLINWIARQNGLFQWFMDVNSKRNNDNNPQNCNFENWNEKQWQ